jgi:antitoxin component YwqK of YwqJK toxin-antitoxin module
LDKLLQKWQVSSTYGYVDGKSKEEYVRYFEDGTISLKNEKIDGELIQMSYYESGDLRYKRQVSNGFYKGYYETGELKIESNYLKNELGAEWKKYYKNGQLEWLVNYKDGYRDGPYKKFSDKGELVLEGINSKEKINGEETRHKLGKIVEWKGQYQNGILAKTWTKFDDNGKKLLKVKFKNG